MDARSQITLVHEDSIEEAFDYSRVETTARIAVYDDMKAPPRIIEVGPAPTLEFIEALAACIDEQKRLLGGSVPYNVIHEVVENFIHAQFKEMVVSILDGGNTIRFCDQGPGVVSRDRAVLPGFTSATEPMKKYIRGVGSGLPMIKSYLEVTNGRLTIEDNLAQGAVVTISLVPKQQQPPVPLPPLDDKELVILNVLATEGVLGVTEIAKLTDLAASTTQVKLGKLEESGLVSKDERKKRGLTEYGEAVIRQIR